MTLWEKRRHIYPSLIYFSRTAIGHLPLESIEIETTSICNRKCWYCPNATVGRPQGYMKEENFYTAIDSLKKNNFKGTISPNFYGEPLMDQRLPTFVKYIRDQLPFVKINIFTNGDLLTIQKYRELKKLGVDLFRISQHSEEASESIKETLKFIKDNYPELYTVECVNYYSEETEKMNRGGLVKISKAKKFKWCDLVNRITIDYLGNAVLCCNDYLSSIIFGNINERDIYDIWNGTYYRMMRALISFGLWPYKICKICSHGL